LPPCPPPAPPVWLPLVPPEEPPLRPGSVHSPPEQIRPPLQSEATSQRSPVPCLQLTNNNGTTSNTALANQLPLLLLLPSLFMLGAGLARRARGRPLHPAIA